MYNNGSLSTEVMGLLNISGHYISEQHLGEYSYATGVSIEDRVGLRAGRLYWVGYILSSQM